MAGAYDTWVERARAVPIESEITRRGIKLRRSGAERIGPCPKCGGTDRFSINVTSNVWNCRHCKPPAIAGDVIGLVEWLDDADFNGACETLVQEPPPAGKANGKGNGADTQPHEVAWYDYTDEAGRLIFQVVRIEPGPDGQPKTFRQRRPLAGGGWDWSVKGVRAVPFRLPELIEAIASEHTVYVVEGEKDVLTLARVGLPATCNAGGAGKWRSDLNEHFADADVVIIGDHDPQATNKKTGEKLFHEDGRQRIPGFDHAVQVAENLKPIARDVRMFIINELWPACPLKGDVTDWFDKGDGTLDALNDFVARRPSWAPGGATPAPAAIPITFPFPISAGDIPRRPWIVPGLLLRRQVTVMVAPPGSGKSLLSLQLGLVCATGVTTWPWRTRGKFRVLIINAEEDGDELRRRLFAAREFMRLPDNLLAGFAFADSPESIVIAKADSKTKTVLRTPMLDRIIATITANAFDIVIVDPFAETFAGDENSNSELKWAAALWREVARRTNAAVFLIHHTRKYAHDMAGDPDAGRGGGALAGVARIVSTLFTMTEKEADAFGIDPQERVKYIRYDDAKANLTLVSFNARWFCKHSVVLPNAGDGEPADEVGVLEPWTPPDALAGLTTDEVKEILKIIKQGVTDQEGKPGEVPEPYSPDIRSGDRWAGTVIKRFRGKCSNDQAKKVLNIWIRNRFLATYDAKTPTSKGKLRQCLKVTGGPGLIEENRNLDLFVE